jgi:hypothetical protein
MSKKTQKIADLDEIRTAVADYMASEGCSCCQDREAHKEHTDTLAKILDVEEYSDKSGYNFSKYESKK